MSVLSYLERTQFRDEFEGEGVALGVGVHNNTLPVDSCSIHRNAWLSWLRRLDLVELISGIFTDTHGHLEH